MDRTDRHYRYLMRLISPRARLYTEMITASALLYGDRARLLEYDEREHPVAIQLGGSDPDELADAAGIAAHAGYDEINLNVGCPSGRVQSGNFGVKLMLEPALVAECVAALREASNLPVTVKTRIGVDEHDDYEFLRRLTERVVQSGVSGLIVHARKAWLEGLSPKQNRDIPPLDYARVYRLKQEFEDLPIVINGGFDTEHAVLEQTGRVDGVMLGRAAYGEPMLVGRIDACLSGVGAVAREAEVLTRYAGYVRAELDKGTPLTAMTRHLSGLFKHRPGARRWRQKLAALRPAAGGIDELIGDLASVDFVSRYNAQSAGNGTP
jgi:tRNA-dihydrouridine synthase A